MKNLILIIAIGLLISSCNEKKVPKEVQIHFLELEPSADNIDWSLNKNIYRVYYTLNTRKYTSYFDKNGNWLETESEIDKSELPIEILNTINEKLSEYQIIDIELVKTADDQVLYEIDLKKGEKIYDILFDKSGKILRKKI